MGKKEFARPLLCPGICCVGHVNAVRTKKSGAAGMGSAGLGVLLALALGHDVHHVCVLDGLSAISGTGQGGFGGAVRRPRPSPGSLAKVYGTVESYRAPSSTGAPFLPWLFGTPTITVLEQVPPLLSSAVKPMW